MSSTRNGRDQTDRDPARRLRFDDFASIVTRNSPGPRQSRSASESSRDHSGRRFVLVAGCALLVIWGALYLAFRDWRAKYRARALYGMTQVVPAIDPLRTIVPAGVERAAWQGAIDQTRSMLSTVTGSNLLGVQEMMGLRAELDEHVVRARNHPDQAVAELAAIWNEIADRGEFLLKDGRSASGDRHPRPGILPPRPSKPQKGSLSAPVDVENRAEK